MLILWITSILFPEVQTTLKVGKEPIAGGWMLGASNALISQPNIQLYVASVSEHVNHLTRIKGNRINYYVIPYGKGNLRENAEYEPYWKEISNEITPDVVHIHGTEFSHGLSYINACGSKNVVISIQGLTSAIYPYTLYGLNKWLLLRNITIRDIIKGNSLSLYNEFKKRGKFEIKMISSVNHIIGRTSWDKARIWAINPNAEYHFCNETLRSEFYDGQWMFDNCDKHTIFFSSGTDPYKGLHILLRAMPIILRHHPDTQIRVAGSDVTRCSYDWKDRLKLTDYGRIIRKILRKYGIEDKVSFLGSLNSSQMKKEFLRANIFVLSSSIENSPNTLGEAQLLGVPCISSYVGGTMDMIPNDACGELYRFEEVEMLAYKVCQMFNNSPTFDNSIMRIEAAKRHDMINNAKNLIHIYKYIAHCN